MLEADRNILPLPSSTRSKLRSTQILTSLPQIITELIQNALDANAKHIDVGVNYEEWMCYVRDDGVGVSKEGMQLLAEGGESGRYGSSKTYQESTDNNQTTFGFRGEALASAADLSCLEISSRTSKSKESWSVILRGGKQVYYGPAVHWRRESHGTVVCVRDAFYNVPVRRRSHPNTVKTLELIRREIEISALIAPEVAFSCDDLVKKQDTTGKGRVITVPQTSSSLACFRHIYGSSLVQHTESVSSKSGAMELDGFISVDGSQTKAYQFLYINRHPIRYSEIHRVIDKLFTESSFSKHAYDELGENSLPRSGSRRSPRKTERRPVYMLNLTLPTKEVDNFIEPAKSAVHLKNEAEVLSFISDVIRGFLRKHRFLTESPVHYRDCGTASPSPTQKRKILRSIDTENHSHRECLQQTAKPHLPIKHVDSLPIYADVNVQEGTKSVFWTDRSTGEQFVVDPRTGNSYSKRRLSTQGRVSPTAMAGINSSSQRTLVDTSTLKKRREPYSNSRDTEPPVPGWIKSALQANNTFNVTESSVRSLRHAPLNKVSEGTCDPVDSRPFISPPSFQESVLASSNLASSDMLSRRFSVQELRDARVICQIDKKFVACLVGAEEEPTLVLIDQHAADERIRVERFLGDLCLGYLRRDIERRVLEPAKLVVLTQREKTLLRSWDDRGNVMLNSWGFSLIESPQPADSNAKPKSAIGGGYVQFMVETVPDVISEKLIQGDELQQLVRSLLSGLEMSDDGTSNFSPPFLSEEDASSNNWVKALRHCPRELVELINSKACRGAIMFSDPLSREQCTRLISQLAKTKFPFQCAHGRPSLVPLVSLPGSSSLHRPRSIDWSSFIDKDGIT